MDCGTWLRKPCRPRLTGAVFLNVAKAFDTVLVKGLLYKLTVLNFPSYLVKTICSYLDCRTFQTSSQSATSTFRGVRAGVAQGGLTSFVLFSLYVNDIPTPSRHVELAQYASRRSLCWLFQQGGPAVSGSKSKLLVTQQPALATTLGIRGNFWVAGRVWPITHDSSA
jgi:hypothetical protein